MLQYTVPCACAVSQAYMHMRTAASSSSIFSQFGVDSDNYSLHGGVA